MIKLINGRGQLGKKINEIISKRNFIQPLEDILVYHTWNTEQKSKIEQKKQYELFKKFVDKNKNEKIIFVSTYSQKENFYNHYKQRAEAYLITNSEKGIIIKLPTIIGKGICKKLKDGEATPYGDMQLISLKDAALAVIDKINYSGVVKCFTVKGETIRASTVFSLYRDVE